MTKVEITVLTLKIELELKLLATFILGHPSKVMIITLQYVFD